MAWYYGTFSCGHEGRVNIVGPTKNRQWIADKKFSGLCEECYEKKLAEDRERENAAAAEKAKEMELPELKGSEKQVAWANTLRQKLIDNVEEILEDIEERKGNRDLANSIFDYILTNKTEAKWYIDNRVCFGNHKMLEILFDDIHKEMPTEEKIREEKAIAEINAEATVYPENCRTNATVEIRILDGKVAAIFEKDDRFMRIVKELNYSWSGQAWERRIGLTTGSAVDRAAELGNKLLNAGFPIILIDNEAREKAINGTYEPQCKRWIAKRTKGEYAGWFSIGWTDGSDLYDMARRLPGSRYDRPNVMVKPEHYEEVEDFANMYGFRLSPGTVELIESAKAAKDAALKVNPAKVVDPEAKDGLKEILNSGSDILDDLKD